MQTVRSFANEDGERQRYSDKLQDVYKIQFKQAMSYSGYIWSTQVGVKDRAEIDSLSEMICICVLLFAIKLWSIEIGAFLHDSAAENPVLSSHD